MNFCTPAELAASISEEAHRAARTVAHATLDLLNEQETTSTVKHYGGEVTILPNPRATNGHIVRTPDGDRYFAAVGENLVGTREEVKQGLDKWLASRWPTAGAALAVGHDVRIRFTDFGDRRIASVVLVSSTRSISDDAQSFIGVAGPWINPQTRHAVIAHTRNASGVIGAAIEGNELRRAGISVYFIAA